MDSTKDRSIRREESIEGRYANYFEVGHNAYEFLLDFGQYEPNSKRIQMQMRVVTGPVFAKLFAGLLSQAVTQFEGEHGEIQSVEDELDPLELVRQSIGGFERQPDAATARARSGK